MSLKFIYLLSFFLIRIIFCEGIDKYLLEKEKSIKFSIDHEIQNYEINLIKLIEEKYKYSLDLYIGISDLYTENYFQMKSLLKNASESAITNITISTLNDIYLNSYHFLLGDSKQINYPNRNLTMKNIIKKTIEIANENSSSFFVLKENYDENQIDKLISKYNIRETNKSETLIDYSEINIMNYPYQSNILVNFSEGENVNEKINPIFTIKFFFLSKFLEDTKINYLDILCDFYKEYKIIKDKNYNMKDKLSLIFNSPLFRGFYDSNFFFIDSNFSNFYSNCKIIEENQNNYIKLPEIINFVEEEYLFRDFIILINSQLDNLSSNFNYVLINNHENRNARDKKYSFYVDNDIKDTKSFSNRTFFDMIFLKKFEKKLRRKIEINSILLDYLSKKVFSINLRNYLLEDKINKILEIFNKLLSEISNFDFFTIELDEFEYSKLKNNIAGYLKLLDENLSKIDLDGNISRIYYFVMLIIFLYSIYTIYMAYKYFRIYYQKKIQ